MQKQQRKYFLLLGIMLFVFSGSQAQIAGNDMDERALYAMTKQMSQFFSRFNNEEDQFGKKYHPNAKEYRNNKTRKNILPLLFDAQNPRTGGSLQTYFIEDLTQSDSNFMKFTGGHWYAEVSSKFLHKGKEVEIVLILTVEKEGLGSKWVLTNIYYPDFSQMFPTGEIVEREKHFLHPMSHELDFMNIYKAFQTPEVIELYASKEFTPDYLTLFFYEIKKKNLLFKNVNTLKFHIFQIQNWYFEVSWFNRPGENSGWLISNLMFISEAEKENLLKFYQP